jgi:hypothetical protein
MKTAMKFVAEVEIQSAAERKLSDARLYQELSSGRVTATLFILTVLEPTSISGVV